MNALKDPFRVPEVPKDIESGQADVIEMQTMFDSMNEGFCLMELVCTESGEPHDLRHVLANPAYARQTGRKLSEIAGHTARELHPGFAPHLIAQLGKVALTGMPAHFETRFDLDGRWFEVRAYQVSSKRLAALFFDVTLRRKMNDHVRLQAAIFNNAEEGIVITDAQGRVMEANPAFERTTEYSLAELRGKKLNVLQSGRQDRQFYQRMWKALLGSGRWQGEIWNRRKGGEVYIEWITISAMRNDANEIDSYIGTSIDLSRMNHAKTELERLAHHDALTGMPNRLLLITRLEHAIDRAKRVAGLGAVLFVDLDRFKQVNDSLGHLTGDELLKAVAARLRARLRDVDTLARIGGDEFVILLEDIASEGDAAKVTQDLISQLDKAFTLPGEQQVRIGASIGIALFPGDGATATNVIEQADQALYMAKACGRGVYRFYRTT